jgi:hypothetical protein
MYPLNADRFWVQPQELVSGTLGGCVCGGVGRERGRERGREGEPVTSQRLSSQATPWMLMDDWPYGYHPELAVLQATLSTQLLLDGYRNTTLTMAAERSEAGSFTDGAAAAEALVGSSLGTLGICRRSSAV